MSDLDGKVVVITGAASGIGASLAKECAVKGARVVLADLNLEAAKEVASKLDPSGKSTLVAETDVAVPASLQALADATMEKFGDCHVLFNNAGAALRAAMADVQTDQWDRLIAINLSSVAYALKAFLPTMCDRPDKRYVVNTASMGGLIPFSDFAPYTATKYAVVGLSESLHEQLKPRNIGVSVICPGLVDTQLLKSDMDLKAEQKTEAEEIDSHMPAELSRVLSPDDVAKLAISDMFSDKLFIITHKEWLGAVEARHNLIKEHFQ